MTPLAERMRPKIIRDYLGQSHIMGVNSPILAMINHNAIASMIFWGPPGVGKTTLAELIAKETGREFYSLSAVSSGVKEVKEIIEISKKKHLFSGKTPILFIDEIHRFNKAQQDSLLQAVEKGWVILIGATTENPSFEVVSALLSRCQVYVLNSFSKEELIQLLKKTIKEDEFLKKYTIKLKETEALLQLSGGDARKLLNMLELIVQQQLHQEKISITNELTKAIIQENIALYDKNGEQHYDVISAFIKSIRGSDPQAAVYWLARMLIGGEDIKFIARRLIILAAEDIGLANPTALVIANNTFQAINVIGMPEARIILSECVIYLATSPKSNSAYKAINQAMKIAGETKNLPVPLHLRNAPTQLMKELNYGGDYKYPHDYNHHYVQQNYLPEELLDTIFWNAQNNAKEQSLSHYLSQIKGS